MKKERSKTNNQLFDAMLHKACEAAAEDMFAEESLPEDVPDFSEEHKAKMEELFKRADKKGKIMKLTQITKMAACVLLVFTAVSLTTILSVESMRSKVFNYIFHEAAPYTEIEFGAHEPEYIGDYVMNYIPSGFDVIEKCDDGQTFDMVLNNDTTVLKLRIISADGIEKRIDTEEGEVKEVIVNGCDAVYSSNDRTNLLMWSDGESFLTLKGKLDERILIKIAENIKRR